MDNENIAKATGRDLPISTKKSIEVCNFIRGLHIKKVKIKLNDVIKQRMAVPYKRFNKDLGHKKNIMSGRYPIKTCKYILDIIESAEANAKNIGLNTDNLIISRIIANKASRPWRQGRKRRIKMKRTHIEVVVSEVKND
ncbi:50S ribosomal protein L22 [Candidatus Woesearchaeota archaeon]|nr:50S ribosomal protein L22 [Candidatus Woesearchaeota archaeon]